MNWYKTAAAFEDIKNLRPSDEIEENITLLHEMQYKSFEIQRNHGKLSPRAVHQILTTMHAVAYGLFAVCRDEIKLTFQEWLKKHPTQDRNFWADMVIESLEQISGSDYIVEAVKNGVYWGSVSIKPDEIARYVRKDFVLEIIDEEMQNNIDSYKYMIERFLNQYYPGYGSNDEDYKEYIEQNGLEDEVKEYIYRSYDIRSLLSNLSSDSLERAVDLHEAIADLLYDYYIQDWGVNIEAVKEDIQEAVDRMDSLDENSETALLAQAISLAVGVMHANGNIMSDYGGNLSRKYLDALHTGLPEQKEWEEELKTEFGVQPLVEEKRTTPLDMRAFR